MQYSIGVFERRARVGGNMLEPPLISPGYVMDWRAQMNPPTVPIRTTQQQQQAPSMRRLSPFAFFLLSSCEFSSLSLEKARPIEPTMYPSDLVAEPYDTGVRDEGLLKAIVCPRTPLPIDRRFSSRRLDEPCQGVRQTVASPHEDGSAQAYPTRPREFDDASPRQRSFLQKTNLAKALNRLVFL